MRQKIQRLLFLSVGISGLIFPSEPVIPLIQPALAASSRDTATVQQNNAREKFQDSSQADQTTILRENEFTRTTDLPYRLLGRNTSSRVLEEMSNDVLLQSSPPTSPVTLVRADDSQSKVMSLPSTAVSSRQSGGTMRAGLGAISVAKDTSSLLGSTSPTSKAVAAPQPNPMQVRPLPGPMRRLMSEMPELKQLAAPHLTLPSPKPVIGVSSSRLSFSAQQGDGRPATQTLTVTNVGGGTLNWNAAVTAAWLTLSPASGKDAGTIAVTLTAGSLAIGAYNTTIIVNAPGATAVTIPVNLTVEHASVPPVIRTSPTGLSFTVVQGDSSPSTQTVSISNSGGGILSWSASENVSWLAISPSSGTGNGSIAATATPGSLVPGIYNSTITISATNAASVSIPITFTVTPPSATVTLYPSSLTFSGIQWGGNPASQTVTVNTNGNWTASSSAAWLTLNPSSGNSNGSIAANVALSSAAVGPNNATITVTSGGVSRTISVTLTVSAASLTVSPTSLTYTATRGAANPSPQIITITSNGTWSAGDGASWLSLSSASGSNNGTIMASVNTATATQENNSTTITVMSGGITRTVNVSLTLNPPSSSSVTLTWNSNTESDLAGYRVYRATSSGAYGAPIATIQGNTTSYIATGLQFGTTYYFVVTAFDIAGNESSYSNEVSKSIF